MLRVLYLPIGGQSGTVAAWKSVGVSLDVYDFYDRWTHTKNKTTVANEFLQRVAKFNPNLIHMQLQFTGLIGADTLLEARRIVPGVIITNWSGDVRSSAVANFTQIAKALDYSLISSTGQLDMYKKAGCNNIRYWQIGYDPKCSFPCRETTFKYDVSFLGNNYSNTFPDGALRLNTVKKLRNIYKQRCGLFGSGYSPVAPMVDPTQANSIYNNSVCALSISNFNNISHYFSDRLLYCLASGRPTISWYFPGIEDYFIEGQEIFVARSVDDIIGAIDYCKKNPARANQIGINGYNRVFREHTFKSRIIELLSMVNLIDMV